MTAYEWQQECIYISGVADKRGAVQEMNYDVNVFKRYCHLMRSAAESQGFHDTAQYIQHCIDDLEDA